MSVCRLISWNVNGIRAVEKKGFLDWLPQQNAEIICLQETKAEESQLSSDLRNIPGYSSIFCSGERKGYSGVAIYTRVPPKSISRGFGIPSFDMEGRILIAEYDAFTLMNIYFPNGKASPERLAYKMDFYRAFLAYLDERKDKKFIVCGDYNTAHKEIDLARPKENEKTSGFLPIERAWMDEYVQHGHIDTLRQFHPAEPNLYSWWDMKSGARARNIGWRIDYFFTSENLRPNLKAAGLLPDVMGSDHCPITLDIDVSWPE